MLLVPQTAAAASYVFWFYFLSQCLIVLKHLSCVLLGGEPDVGCVFGFSLFCFVIFCRWCLVLFFVFLLSIASPGEHDSDTTTAVDEVRKTRLTRAGRRRQTG